MLRKEIRHVSRFTRSFSDEEVEYGFLESLIPEYVPRATSGTGTDIFTLLGKFVRCEMHTYTGRVDCILETSRYIYLFEFKRDDTAETALAQINEKDYALPFVADSRKLYKIGVTFDSEKRILSDWKVQ